MSVIAFYPGGRVRKLFATSDRQYGAVPRRASRVEVIEVGPQRGLFHVDMTPLGEEHAYCLLTTFADYDTAVRAERAWLAQHWVLDQPI